jgi:hypothetical protein
LYQKIYTYLLYIKNNNHAHISRIGSSVEWNVLYKLAKDKNGLLQKETIRGVYDGSLFEVLKKEHTKRINSS